MFPFRILLTVWLTFIVLASSVNAQENDDCLECHEEAGLKVERQGREISLHVDPKRFAESVHGDTDCISCHQELDGAVEDPHLTGLKPVNCAECHEDDDGPIAPEPAAGADG